MIRRVFVACFFLLSSSLAAQDLPDKIRGYKVHQPKSITVNRRTPGEIQKAKPLSLKGVKLISITLSGVAFETVIDIEPLPHDGKIDFLTFHDFRVNDVLVEIEEYATPFIVRKNEPIVLPKPATVFLATPRIMQVAWKEMRDSQPEWIVTGRVFVFGRFKKYGMTFKRVVPVDISFRIKNPTRQ